MAITLRKIKSEVKKLTVEEIEEKAEITLKLAKAHKFTGIKEIDWSDIACEVLIVLRLCEEIEELQGIKKAYDGLTKDMKSSGNKWR